MSLPLDLLLEPVSAADPCGPELLMEVDAYQEQAAPRESTFSIQGAEAGSQALKPGALVAEGTRLLARSKDIRTAVILTLCALRQTGLGGFRDGLTLIARLLDQHWDSVHPRIEPDDPDGPVARANAIDNLAQPFGKPGDSYRLIRHLRNTVLFSPAKAEPVTFGLLLTAKGIPPARADGPVLSEAQVKDLLSVQPADDAGGVAAMTRDCLKQLETIEAIFQKHGGQSTPHLDPLYKELRAVDSLLTSPEIEGDDDDEEEDEDEDEDDGGKTGPGGGKTVRLNGEIQTREEVISALDAVCKFYQDREPSSPVPFLIQWARRLVGRNFIDVIKDLAPDTETKIRGIIGHAEAKPD